jgi:hypothetical protein
VHGRARVVVWRVHGVVPLPLGCLPACLPACLRVAVMGLTWVACCLCVRAACACVRACAWVAHTGG